MISSEEKLKVVENLLKAQEWEKARDIILTYHKLPGQSISQYFKWAKFCEILALPYQAIYCYEQILTLDKENFKAIKSLGLLYFEIGEFEKAKRLLIRYLKNFPHDEETKQALGEIYKSLKEWGAFYSLFPEKKSDSPKLKIRTFPKNFTDSEIAAFLPFVQGQHYHGELKLNLSGKPEIIVKQGALDSELIKKHLLGENYFFTYPIDEEKEIGIGEFKIFLPKKIVYKNIKNPHRLTYLEDLLFDSALKSFRKFIAFGFSGILEKLTPWEYRVFFILENPLHFLMVKKFLKKFEEKLPIFEEGVVFSSWTFTAPRDLHWEEVPFALPLGKHPVTLERTKFFNKNGEEIKRPLLTLKKLRPIKVEEIKEFLKTGKLFWKIKENEILKKLRKNCPLLNCIIKKAQAGKSLSNREKTALFLTLGLLEDSGKLLHEVLFFLPDYSYEKVEKLRKGFPKNPISCYKLREWFPDLVSINSCSCVFEDLNCYPSPVLHINPDLVPQKEENLENLSLKELGKKFITLLKEKDRIENLLKEAETCLKMKMDKEGRCFIEVKDYIIKYNSKKEKIEIKKKGENYGALPH